MNVFGANVEEVSGKDVHGEFAFITGDISEKDFDEKLWKMDSVKGYLRLY